MTLEALYITQEKLLNLQMQLVYIKILLELAWEHGMGKLRMVKFIDFSLIILAVFTLAE